MVYEVPYLQRHTILAHLEVKWMGDEKMLSSVKKNLPGGALFARHGTFRGPGGTA